MKGGRSWGVYLVRCADGTLYCGIARDVPARIAAHDAGIGARYTRGRGPLTLLAVRTCRAHGTALRLEHAVKQLSRVEKLALAADPGRLAALARAVLRAGAAQRKRAAASQRGSGSHVRRTSRSG